MRYAICNETFEGWDHDRVCRFVAGLGYSGLEIAPFTLAARAWSVSPDRRREVRRQAEDAGLAIVGLHWLLARTDGFHLTSPEPEVRRRTADYLVALAELCRDLGGELMVFGSPAQRQLLPGVTPDQATEFAADTFSRALPAVAARGVKICWEPLAPTETDFGNTCAHGVELIDKVGHPALALHLDVKAMSSEKSPVPDLIRRFAGRAAHFHANDPNRRGPGFGATDFVPILRALQDAKYQGWVSVEVFDYSPDPETIARESIRYLKECAAKAGLP
jgi:sugar phosphate isomerase/epimerase